MLTLFVNNNIFFLWQGRFISLFGSQFFNVALLYWIVDKTGSSLHVGILFFMTGMATTASQVLGGYFADRFSRKKLVVICDALCFLLVAAIAFVIFSNDTQIVPVLLILVFLKSACHGLFVPTMNSLIPALLVKKTYLELMGCLKSLIFQLW